MKISILYFYFQKYLWSNVFQSGLLSFNILKKVKNNRIQGLFYPKDIINL